MVSKISLTSKRFFEEQTEDYGGLILVNNMSKKNSLQENVFKYRAPSSIPSFKMGRPVFWKWNEMYSKSRMTTSYNTHNAKLYQQSNQTNENKHTQAEKRKQKKKKIDRLPCHSFFKLFLNFFEFITLYVFNYFF